MSIGSVTGYTPPLWQRALPLGWVLWLTRPIRCKLGRHRWDEHSWGYGFGQLDWFCPLCQKRIGSTQLDDMTGEQTERVAAAMRILEELSN